MFLSEECFMVIKLFEIRLQKPKKFDYTSRNAYKRLKISQKNYYLYFVLRFL